MELIIFKRFTTGMFKGMRFQDKLKVKSLNDLSLYQQIGQEITPCVGDSKYVIDNIYIYDRNTDNYLTINQAQYKLGE